MKYGIKEIRLASLEIFKEANALEKISLTLSTSISGVCFAQAVVDFSLGNLAYGGAFSALALVAGRYLVKRGNIVHSRVQDKRNLQSHVL